MDTGGIAADVALYGGAVLVAGGVLTLLGKASRGAWRATKSIHRLADAMLGDKEQDKAGVVERLDRIDVHLDDFGQRLSAVEAQVYPNGGKSLHDKVNQIKETVTP